MSVPMKIMAHDFYINSFIPTNPDPLQFAYQLNKSSYDTISQFFLRGFSTPKEEEYLLGDGVCRLQL